ncbi:MAG: lipoprotein-releasing ABC transporter permease subunit [Thermodesulfobacteriota bacterium]
MAFELFLGLRYLKAKRRQGFISVITIISVTGVMVGVMALVVVLSVMNGFRADLLSKILGVNSHLLVLSYDGPVSDYDALARKVSEAEGVVATTPFIYTQVMVNHAGNVSGAVYRGLETASAGPVIDIEPMLKGEGLEALNSETGETPGIILGNQLARQLGARTGSEVTLISPQGRLTPMGRMPGHRKYRVVDLLDSGMYEYDATLAYVSLREAQDFLGMGDRVTGLEVRVEDVNRSDEVAAALEKALGYPFWTKDWKVMNRSLFAALKLEKVTMFVILTMIVLVGALNIISTLVMVVMEKTRDMAILRAMGATAKSIMAVFMFQGLLVGVAGTIAGLGSGLGICHLLAKYRFISLPADVYYISTLPVRVEAWDVGFVGFAAVVISFLATIYPSWYAARLDPVEALRYE